MPFALLGLAACAGPSLVDRPDDDELATVEIDDPSCPRAPHDAAPDRVAKMTEMTKTLLDAVADDDPERSDVEIALAELHLAAANYRPACAVLEDVLARSDPRRDDAFALHGAYCTDDRRSRCGDLELATPTSSPARDRCDEATVEKRQGSCRDGVAACCELAAIFAEYACLERRATGTQDGGWCLELVDLYDRACASGREHACQLAQQWRTRLADG
jgi:hypothetical protein